MTPISAEWENSNSESQNTRHYHIPIIIIASWHIGDVRIVDTGKLSFTDDGHLESVRLCTWLRGEE